MSKKSYNYFIIPFCPELNNTCKCLQICNCENCGFYHTNKGENCKGCKVNMKKIKNNYLKIIIKVLKLK